MPRIVRTARGLEVDFDAIVIKQQIAQAPMNIDVARRKEFIDSKEGKRGVQRPVAAETQINTQIIPPVNQEPPKPADFELEDTPVLNKSSPVEAIPDIPERKKK